MRLPDMLSEAFVQELTAKGPFPKVSIEVSSEDGESELRDASAPYYWAAFQIYGDWQ